MGLSKEAMEKIIDSRPQDIEMASWVVSQLNLIESIRNQIQEREKELQLAKQRYEQEVLKISASIGAVRKGCRHWSWTHQSDPSGNRNSCNTCDQCGKSDEFAEYRHT